MYLAGVKSKSVVVERVGGYIWSFSEQATTHITFVMEQLGLGRLVKASPLTGASDNITCAW